MKSAFSALVFLIATSALATEPVQKGDLLGKVYTSPRSACTVSIFANEAWQTNCDELTEKFGGAVLSGRNFNIVQAEIGQVIQFSGKTRRPLQALVTRIPADAIATIQAEMGKPVTLMVGLVYGPLADGGMVELYAE